MAAYDMGCHIWSYIDITDFLKLHQPGIIPCTFIIKIFDLKSKGENSKITDQIDFL